MAERLLGLARSAQSLWQFDIKWNPPSTNLTGKVALVTGGSRGMGRETAKQLALRGADVWIGCRDTRKAKTLAEEVRRDAWADRKPGAIDSLYLDLADLDSVASFAAELRGRAPSLDILVANAGIAGEPYQKSKQGHERHFAVNHLGHFMLVQELLDVLLKAQARVVVVGSHLHALVADSTPDYKYRTALLGGWLAYSRSKLGKAWFAYELQRRYPALTVPLLHPGIVNTGIVKTSTPVVDQLLALVKPVLLISPARGALTPTYCAVAPGARGGQYYHNVLGNIRTSRESYDERRAAAFWELCDSLCAPHYSRQPASARR